MLHLTDSLTGKKTKFTPRDPGKATVYWCGPTVYDIPHLGHARSSLAFDILVRYLRWVGFDVTAVSNITDIDDKIIRRAAEEKTTEQELARRYEDIFISQMDRLNIARPDIRPRATEYVDSMISVIDQLIKREMAYVTEAGVYYDVDRLDSYGTLTHQTISQLRENAGARVEIDEGKDDPLDFALWKAAKAGEPQWDSPWGAGRPGWHIECVAMSLELLGEGFDIHGGGDDLVFHHHENERAECLGCGQKFARVWVHNGMVLAGSEKMSKSLDNFQTLSEILTKWDPRALRLLVLQTHYRKTMEIGASALATSTAALERLDAFARRLISHNLPEENPDIKTITRFREAMDDDLGTPAAIAIIFDAIREANRSLDADDHPTAARLAAAVVELSSVLGLRLISANGSDVDTDIESLIADRSRAKENKDYPEADRIRDELSNRGIVLEDSPTGTTWRRE